MAESKTWTPPDRAWIGAEGEWHDNAEDVDDGIDFEMLRATPVRKAAPDLLEAADMALGLLLGENIVEDMDIYTEAQVISDLRAAIAKATGEAGDG